ncbi:hypothetical protein MVES1_000164 [Malassezia vespertilionis]|uniref:L-type lectin-like domain-containing protein n=1 Tax=Malassezia vespertilionis TaxID=2020962 RepID=A0A2N1JHB3_9BASI|nr:uncharacterized protein MVES1_000164 [Malassezia vespertilionis]PKI85931.1 hypothetical protein MVES_000160 [Malassezia vespertilionis]WFD04840.1 hypothetical protein MVES1_000164 [Malassezia vespertilionis]
MLPMLLVAAWWALLATVQAARFSGSNPSLQADAIVPMRSLSIFSPYVDSSLQNKYWDFGGDAIVDTNRYIRLTQDRPGEKGWLWSRVPIDANDFEITVEFSINGKSSTSHGDGFAVWLTSERATEGPVFGSCNKWHGVGFFFDTYPNTPHRKVFPSISVVENNGALEYNMDIDGKDQEIASCTAQLRRTNVETRFRITVVRDVYIELAIQNREWNQFTTCMRIPYIELERPYLGFSASTGHTSDNHNIVSVWTNALVYHSRTPADLEKHRLETFGEKTESKNWWSTNTDDPYPSRRKDNKTARQGRSFFGVIFAACYLLVKWTLISAAVGACGYFGYMYYRKRSRSVHSRRMMA